MNLIRKVDPFVFSKDSVAYYRNSGSDQRYHKPPGSRRLSINANGTWPGHGLDTHVDHA